MTTENRPTAFVSTPVDMLLIGGFSILHFMLFAWLTRTMALADQALENWLHMQLSAAVIASSITWVINHPHFSATSARLYHSRASMMQFPVTAFGVPVVVLVMSVLAMANPATVAPWFIKLYFVWSSYHFSAQTLGISLLYARRAGLVIEGVTRRILSFFVFSSFLAPMLRAESLSQPTRYYDVAMPVLGLPPGLYALIANAMIAMALLGIILLLRAAWQQEKRVPLLMLVPVAAQFCWFMPGSYYEGFREFVPAYHSLQYLFIAWFMNLREKQVARGITPSVRYVTRQSLFWLALNIAGGIVLFWVLPNYAQYLGFSATPYQTWGIVIAAVQVHHFFVDGVIWKLKNPQVGQPLMASLHDMSGSKA